MILNDKELEALIREEFSAATPDNFDIILERIQASRNQKEQETRTNKRAVSNLMKLAWAAVLVLVLGTGIVGYRSTKIPTDVIQIDVNPSVAIEVNRYGDVVNYQGLNKDAATILEKEKGIIYNRIWRLKGKISTSEAPDKDEFVALLNA